MGNTAPPSMDTTSTTLLSQLMVAVIIGTFFIIALLFFLHLYVKWYWSRNSEDPNTVAWRRRTAAAATTTRNGGLQPLALRSLPVVEFNPKDFKDGLECAVCLSELSQGEKARILPKCNHGFHVDCIDMWFQCHSTCPLCRTNVVSGQNPTSLNPNSTGANNNVDDHQEVVNTSLGSSDHNNGSFRIPVFPTNVLFWGDETQVRSLGVPLEEGHDVNNNNTSSLASTSGEDHGLVIEIPSGELCEDCSCSSPKENKSPVMTRLRSLKRLLSREKRLAMAPSPRGSSSGDVEHV